MSEQDRLTQELDDLNRALDLLDKQVKEKQAKKKKFKVTCLDLSILSLTARMIPSKRPKNNLKLSSKTAS
jgi:hypothetical protein